MTKQFENIPNKNDFISVENMQNIFPNAWVTLHTPAFDEKGIFLGGFFLYGGKSYDKAHNIIQNYPLIHKKKLVFKVHCTKEISENEEFFL